MAVFGYPVAQENDLNARRRADDLRKGLAKVAEKQ
jgi:hypothetical protein